MLVNGFIASDAFVWLQLLKNHLLLLFSSTSVVTVKFDPMARKRPAHLAAFIGKNLLKAGLQRQPELSIPFQIVEERPVVKTSIIDGMRVSIQ